MSDMAQRLVTGTRNLLNPSEKSSHDGATTERRPAMSYEDAITKSRETVLFMIFSYAISTSTMAMMTLANFTVPMFLFLTFASVWWALVVISSADTYWLTRTVSPDEHDSGSDHSESESVVSKSRSNNISGNVSRTARDRFHDVIEGTSVFKDIVTCVYVLGVCGAILSIFIPGAFWKATACMCSTMLLVPGIGAVAWGFTVS